MARAPVCRGPLFFRGRLSLDRGILISTPKVSPAAGLLLFRRRHLYSKELRQMNKIALLFGIAVAALTFGAATTATTRHKSQAYALSAAQVVEDGATRTLRYVWQHI
jgi:hypothetical protein